MKPTVCAAFRGRVQIIRHSHLLCRRLHHQSPERSSSLRRSSVPAKCPLPGPPAAWCPLSCFLPFASGPFSAWCVWDHTGFVLVPRLGVLRSMCSSVGVSSCGKPRNILSYGWTVSSLLMPGRAVGASASAHSGRCLVPALCSVCVPEEELPRAPCLMLREALLPPCPPPAGREGAALSVASATAVSCF